MKDSYMDYKGRPRPRPYGFSTVIAEVGDIVEWSWNPKTHMHRIVYGLQSTDYATVEAAGAAFSECIIHNFICDGGKV